jgi:glucokinase
MRYLQDHRIVMTLDAGGTNFVFCAVQGEEEIIEPVCLPAYGDNLEQVLQTIITGFKEVKAAVKSNPVAISFCFPGPAEYELGIIGNLENLPSFRGGVALGDMLSGIFEIPVFINNDGDLFTYGEAIAGLLPDINRRISDSESPKSFRTLFGATFGTGYGGGIVSRGQLYLGDNSAQAEINRMRNKLYPEWSAEESVSIRGIRRVFAREAEIDPTACPMPKEIFEIGIGRKAGNKMAAIKAFEELAIVAGDSLANASTLADGLIVLGGGLAGAHPLFLDKLVSEMNQSFSSFAGKALHRLEITVYNLEDQDGFNNFKLGDTREITVPFTTRRIKYDPLKRIGVGISRLGTSRAVSVGAYTYALAQLDQRHLANN